MDKGQQQWDKLINMPQEYENDPSIAQRAIESLQNQPKENWFMRHRKIIFACAVSILLVVGLGLGIGIPLYNKNLPPQIVYYAENNIAYEEVDNPTAFVSEKGWHIRYFAEAKKLTTKAATILDTGEFAFLEQSISCINSIGFFDKIDFWGVGKQNAKFGFYKNFDILLNTHKMGDISISYRLVEMPDTYNRQILARFSYQNCEYFLDIVTELDGIQQLEVYVNMLLS